MALHYLLWKGTNSSTKHIRVRNRMPIVRPQERVEHIAIPGRPGELTQVEGENIYESYIQTAQISVVGAENVEAAEAWLTGEGYVTFDSQPTLRQMARVINAVTLEKHSRNVDTWQADVQFYCDPIKHAVGETAINVTSSGTSIANPGNLPAFPLLKVTGSGAVSIACGGNTIVIPDLTSGWVIDCENKWILASGVPQYNAYTGEFPVLQVGNSTMTFTGSITKIEVTPNWRYL